MSRKKLRNRWRNFLLYKGRLRKQRELKELISKVMILRDETIRESRRLKDREREVTDLAKRLYQAICYSQVTKLNHREERYAIQFEISPQDLHRFIHSDSEARLVCKEFASQIEARLLDCFSQLRLGRE